MKSNSVLIILGILLGLNLLAWVAVWELGGSGGLEVTFFNVGQGGCRINGVDAIYPFIFRVKLLVS